MAANAFARFVLPSYVVLRVLRRARFLPAARAHARACASDLRVTPPRVDRRCSLSSGVVGVLWGLPSSFTATKA
eukprot:5514230-Pleurochrysis_carterae.AAC.1